MTPLSELANDAACSVADFISETGWRRFERLSDLGKVQWRYCHADCDDFALVLAEITSWPVIAVNSVTHGPLHRLVEAPDGRLLDVMGWVTLAELQLRYGVADLVIHRGDHLSQSLIDFDEEFLPLLATIHHLDTAPFTEEPFRALVAQFKGRLETS